MAIAGWLETRDTGRRISFDPSTREADRMHQLMAFVNTGFTAAFSPLWAALEMQAPDPAMQSALRKWGPKRVIERHDRFEEMIEASMFLLGNRPTLADAVLIGVARWLDFHNVAEKERWPKLAALRQRLEADPAVIYATDLESGKASPGTGACVGHIELSDFIERFGR